MSPAALVHGALVHTALAPAVTGSAAPSVFAGGADVIAVIVLLLEFGMLRQARRRDQIRLYAAQSAAISVLAVIVAAARNLPDLYALAFCSAAIKVVIVPVVVTRLLPGASQTGASQTGASQTRAGQTRAGQQSKSDEIAGSGALSVASSVLVAIVVAAFGFFTVGRLPLHSHALPITALAIAFAVVLVAFVLMINRRDVVSQAIGLFSLENGVSLAALVVAASMPLIFEVAFLFDLLVAVVVFGLLIRVHHGRTESLSTSELTSLRG
jgi:hydrogenase-4 component E